MGRCILQDLQPAARAALALHSRGWRGAGAILRDHLEARPDQRASASRKRGSDAKDGEPKEFSCKKGDMHVKCFNGRKTRSGKLLKHCCGFNAGRCTRQRSASRHTTVDDHPFSEPLGSANSHEKRRLY